MDASAPSKLQITIIPFSEWRREIAPLWLMEGSYRFIPPVIDGYGQNQYVGRESFRRILLFPICAEYEGERVGWTSIYNISDEAVRVRGIYVLPEFRSNGIGRAMVSFAMGLWPAPWRTCFMYARASNIERYKRWGFEVSPGHQLRSFEYGEAVDEPGILLMQKDLQQPVSTSRVANSEMAVGAS
jgi:GNAT superfamily N-acetyltransferase